MVSRVVLSTHVVLGQSGVHGVLGVHVDDVIGCGNEIFNRVMTAARAKNLISEPGTLAISGSRVEDLEQIEGCGRLWPNRLWPKLVF